MSHWDPVLPTVTSILLVLHYIIFRWSYSL